VPNADAPDADEANGEAASVEPQGAADEANGQAASVEPQGARPASVAES
jgi:hypothetical protein